MYKVVYLRVLKKEANVPLIKSIIEKLIANLVRKAINFKAVKVVIKVYDKIRLRVISPRLKRYQQRKSL